MLHPILLLILFAIVLDFILSIIFIKLEISNKKRFFWSLFKNVLVVCVLFFFFRSTVNFNTSFWFTWVETSVVAAILVFLNLTIPNIKIRTLVSAAVSIFCITYSFIWLQKTLDLDEQKIEIVVRPMSNYIINFTVYSILLMISILSFFKFKKTS